MENKKKSNGTLVGVLIGIIIMLLVVGVLFVTGTIDFNSNTITTSSNQNIDNEKNVDSNQDVSSNVYSYDEMKGVYMYKSEIQKDELGNEHSLWFNLYLYENGTFSYRFGGNVQSGYIGNYVIKDNTIVLNYLFRTTTSAQIFRTSGTKVLTINSNNVLNDSDPMGVFDYDIGVSNPGNVDLSKDLSSELTDEFSSYLKYSVTDSPSGR